MKIQKAINTLSAMQEDYADDECINQTDALKLGIEALKRCQNLKTHTPPGGYMPLPGEIEAVQRGMSETKFINPETD